MRQKGWEDKFPLPPRWLLNYWDSSYWIGSLKMILSQQLVDFAVLQENKEKEEEIIKHQVSCSSESGKFKPVNIGIISAKQI